MYTLCAVTDRAWVDSSPAGFDTMEQQVAETIAGGATMIQLREKNASEEEFARLAHSVKRVTDELGIPLVINDSLAVALACDAAGLHIGQDDGDAAETRKKIGTGKLLGVSVHTVDEALAAERAGADYLGVGAMFPTSTKDDARAISPEVLSAICGAVRIPVLAIGGITADNAGKLTGCGIAGIAVVSAIFSKGAGMREATRELRAAAERAIAGERGRLS
jgi:thiamine-phosphate pyrophosphorylase